MQERPEENVESRKCPLCGAGDLVDIKFFQGSDAADGEEIQEGDTRQVERYSCGHEVPGPRLDETAAGTDELQVERRHTEDTVEPIEPV